MGSVGLSWAQESGVSLCTEEQRSPGGWRGRQALASREGHSWKGNSLEHRYRGGNRVGYTFWTLCRAWGDGGRGRRGGMLEMGLEKLSSSQGSEHQLSGSTLRAKPFIPVSPAPGCCRPEVCGRTGLFHRGILDESFPALDLALLLLMVGLKVT